MDGQDSLPDISVARLRALMRAGGESELAALTKTAEREFERWKKGKAAIPTESANFLAIWFTVMCRTFDDFVSAGRGHGLEEFIAKAQPLYEQALDRDKEAAVKAKNALDAAFGELLACRTRPCEPGLVRSFSEALKNLRSAAVRYSGASRHRPRVYQSRDREIYEMHEAGKTFAQIGMRLKMSANQAERACARYRERSEKTLYFAMLKLFSQPPPM